MAYRDSRRGMLRLLLSMSCVVLAVALVVLAFSFQENLLASIQTQSKSLLGADLALDSREPFSKDDEKLFHSLGGDQSRQVGFTSMVTFSANGDSRLVQVRAISGQFPYYGALETDPPLSLEVFHLSANALVDENVLLQFNAKVGDFVKIGNHEFRIAGSLRKIPGETLAFSLISPRIYIPMAYLERTQLIQKGSVVRYRVFFKFAAGTQVERILKDIAPQLERLQLESDTVSKRTASIASEYGESIALSALSGVCCRAACRRRRRQRHLCLRQRKNSSRGAVAMHRRPAGGNRFGLFIATVFPDSGLFGGGCGLGCLGAILFARSAERLSPGGSDHRDLASRDCRRRRHRYDDVIFIRSVAVDLVAAHLAAGGVARFLRRRTSRQGPAGHIHRTLDRCAGARICQRDPWQLASGAGVCRRQCSWCSYCSHCWRALAHSPCARSRRAFWRFPGARGCPTCIGRAIKLPR